MLNTTEQKQYKLQDLILTAAREKKEFYLQGGAVCINLSTGHHVFEVSSPTCCRLDISLRDDWNREIKRIAWKNKPKPSNGSKQFQRRHVISQSRAAAE